MTHLKVAVRIRPLSQREINAHSAPIVEIQDQTVIRVTNLKVPEQNAGDSRERIRRFTFDYCFHPNSTQNEVFGVLGKEIEESIRKRYHSCILAYGQSSSGKTHTMMGNLDDPGITPNLCENIFKYLEECVNEKESPKALCVISYLEIYNEKVCDLLVSNDGQPANYKSNSLRIREHPKKGPYVQGLIRRTANDPETLLRWLKIGNANRRVAATLTNPHSSRSHSVFTVTCCEGVQIHLVDLAGSERAGNRYHSISTLKEGANINKSLVALGNVISTLAEHSGKYSRNQRKRFVPYRDSILTWLLKDSLGGNSKTVMVATVSPSSTCYNETVNTLRFGQRAKKIVSYPVVNEDPKERTIRELRAEIEKLKQLLAEHQGFHFLVNPTPKLDKGNAANSTLVVLQNNFQEVKACVPDRNSSDSAPVPLHTQSGQLCMKPEKLLLMMDVTTAVEEKTKQVPKIRRTFSVENTKMDAKPSRPFGSQEAISSSAKEKPKRLSQPSILRKRSLDKSNPSLRNLVLKRVQETKKSSEAGVITEERGPQKQELPKKAPIKPRSQIVAAVTSRLYGKAKKKEVGTETEEIKSAYEEVPKELTICSNARMKLRELSQQALKAHRRKTVDTQTDLFPVLRVKEISTDSDDLKIALAEVKDAETGTTLIETKDAATACFIENFENLVQGLHNAFVVTRTCSTQSTGNLIAEPQRTREQSQNSGVSFTKYLRNNIEPTFQIINPCTANPIYTSSVNINVSHNYINRNRLGDTISDDSLEESDPPNNICFPTPDIISNHNSLEHGNTTSLDQIHQPTIEEKYAICDTTSQVFTTSEILSKTESPKIRVANFFVSPRLEERLNLINIPIVYAPQVCLTKNLEERCGPFWKTLPEPEVIRPTLIESNPMNFPNIHEPVVLKSIMKYQDLCRHTPEQSLAEQRRYEKTNETVKEQPKLANVIQKHRGRFEGRHDNPFSQIPDSLNLHEANNKKVRFHPPKSERMFEAMSKFMEEATNLMTNLTIAASRLQEEQSYDLEVTVHNINDFSSISKPCQQDFTAQTCALAEVSSQTAPSTFSNASSNADTQFQIPVNKYDALVKESCERLEQCIQKVERGTADEQNLHRFPQTFSVNSVRNTLDDSSLDSSKTFSDYGSLPRHKQKKGPSCSPSAYLRQLTTMRQQIVRSSRDELLGETNINF